MSATAQSSHRPVTNYFRIAIPRKDEFSRTPPPEIIPFDDTDEMATQTAWRRALDIRNQAADGKRKIVLGRPTLHRGPWDHVPITWVSGVVK